MPLDTRKIIFFIAGTVATATELGLIARIRGKVVVRSLLQDVTYNTRLEAADGLAGSIPNSYKTGEGTTIDSALYPEGDVTPLIVAAPEDFNVFPATVTVKVGETMRLTAVAADLTDATGAIALTDKAAAVTVVWASSDETKATVDTDGIVTGVAAGTSTITATYTASGASAVESTSAVTVAAATAENVLAVPATLSIAALASGQVFAVESKSDGTVANVTATTDGWASSDPLKATINADTGAISALVAGETTLTFTKGGKTSDCVLTVTG